MRTVGQVRRGKLLIMALAESIAIFASVQAWIRQENGLAQVPAGNVRVPLCPGCAWNASLLLLVAELPVWWWSYVSRDAPDGPHS